jgi:hypothetical protein
MTEPYTPPLIAKLLRAMPADQLAAIRPDQFRMWPAPRIVPDRVTRELIRAERGRRV